MRQKIGPVPQILLVEDNPGDVLLIEEALKDSAILCQLSVAKDGREALDFIYRVGPFANAPRPDLVLLDLNLPRVSGYEVLTSMKGSSGFKEIPVIILTSSSMPEDITLCYALAANCFLCKPTMLDDFFRQVRSLLDFWLYEASLPVQAA